MTPETALENNGPAMRMAMLSSLGGTIVYMETIEVAINIALKPLRTTMNEIIDNSFHSPMISNVAQQIRPY